MGRRLRMDKRGISPVVATVILVAVTIVVAVAVAYWMGGITGLYTRFEKLEIVSLYATKVTIDSVEGWNITITLKNTGSADASIDNILINGRPVSQLSQNVTGVYYDGAKKSASDPISIALAVGKEKVITVELKKGGNFVSGVSVEVRLHSAAGQEYPKTVSLP